MLGFLLSVTGAVFAFAVSGFWIWRHPYSPAARRFLFAAAAGYTLASTYAMPAAVNGILTAGYHQLAAADAPRGSIALVVLGSGSNRIDGWADSLDVMSAAEASRVLEAWRVFRLIAPAIVVSSGGRPVDDEPSEPSGTHMRTELMRLGVPDERIVVDTTTRDTHDESVRIASMLRTRGIEHLVLVTSDTHMRRALGAFRAQGWNAVPAIAPQPNRPDRLAGWVVPSSRGLAFNQEVMHELIGLSYYWLRGWWRY